MAKQRRGFNPLHQLAASVLAGETTEFPWTILRSTYFKARWERAASRDLARWAEAYGIEVTTEQRSAGRHASGVEWVRFSVRNR